MEISINQEEFTMDTEYIALEKTQYEKRNGSNLCGKMMQIRKSTIRESLSNFQGVEHRLEKSIENSKHKYINDSKHKCKRYFCI
jgi:UDP-N-acetylmuramoylalanine--D-glutamate ligase